MRWLTPERLAEIRDFVQKAPEASRRWGLSDLLREVDRLRQKLKKAESRGKK